MIIPCGIRRGRVEPPASKSDLHRLLIGRFLAGDRECLVSSPDDSDDIAATRRCLNALASDDPRPVLDCGESGSTLRFVKPIAAALGRKPSYVMRGRLAGRPSIDYETLAPGVFDLPGDVSSQFATGLLFALPLLGGDSEIRFASPPQSAGYIEMTLGVLGECGIEVGRTEQGFRIPGGQRYRLPARKTPEADWSGAAFWFAMNRLGSEVEIVGLNLESRQPDSSVAGLLGGIGGSIDMAQAPDLFPALAAAAAAAGGTTVFTSVGRLRIKESNRLRAMAGLLSAAGAETDETDGTFTVRGAGAPFAGGFAVSSFGDHRIAMAAAVVASRCARTIEIDDGACVSKSYPGFFEEYARLGAGGSQARV